MRGALLGSTDGPFTVEWVRSRAAAVERLTGQSARPGAKLGVQLALDDFGTGYSSLSHLKRFPIDILKIDRSFVRELTTDSGSNGIVGAVIGMGRNLGMQVVAEGVESREQLACLQELSCPQGQGYYLSEPLTAAEFIRMCRARHTRSAVG